MNRYIQHHWLHRLQQFPLLAMLIPLVLGLLCYRYPGLGNTWIMISCCSIALLGNIILYWWRQRIPYSASLRLGFLTVSFFVAGYALQFSHDIRHSSKWYGHQRSADAYCVQLNQDAVLKPSTVWMPVTVIAAHDTLGGGWQSCIGSFNMYVYHRSDTLLLLQGQQLIVPANALSTIVSNRNPFGFDIVQYYARNNIYHQMFVAPEAIQQHHFFSPSSIRHRWKNTFQTILRANIKDSVTLSLVEATMLNERASLPDDLLKSYSDTGITHIIAISGMHILLFAGIILWPLRFSFFKKRKKALYILSIILVWWYVALTDYPPSAVRAVVMFTCWAIGKMSNKEVYSLNFWALSAIVLLCYNPLWIYNVGFQLSYLAVLSILLFYQPIRSAFYFSKGIINAVWNILALSIAVQILVFPLVIYYFNQFPLWGIIVNIPAAWFSSALMFLSIIIISGGALGFNMALCGKLLAWICQVFHQLIQWFAIHTPLLFKQLYLDVGDCVFLFAAILFFSIGILQRRKLSLALGAVIAVVGIAVNVVAMVTAHKEERIVVYSYPKTSAVDVFKKGSVYHLNNWDEKAYQQITQKAMLGYRVQQEYWDTAQQLIGIKGKRILYARQDQLQEEASVFDIDALILSESATFQPALWYAVYKPQKIILDASFPRWKALKWKQGLESSGAMVHSVTLEGAWVFPR
jgi:competence protein ComEC